MINPTIQEHLQRFQRRRQRLILLRGVCSTVAVWFATMIGLGLLDRFVLMPDALRMVLSAAGYVATAVTCWWECGRQLAHWPDARELARLVELAAPQLHEELLSAVELGETGQAWDSAEFRAALQEAAARDVGGIQVEGLLSRKLIAGWVYGAVGAVALLGVLLVTPGLRFKQSFVRAIAPAANLARYSSVQIKVDTGSRIVPAGDSVPITATVTGPDVADVILETKTERLPMLLSAVNQFTVALQVNQTPVQFRIRARDTITQYFTFTPRPRPHVVRFQKTYHFPAYSRLPARSVTEENGDLDALDGTQVELTLQVDQPVKEAALQLDGGKSVALDNQLTVRMPLVAGIYQVRLVAKETGFENKFSPQYEIRVQPDLIPSVTLEKPDREEVVLPPDAEVSVAGTARDDLALARVNQMFQVNRGEWQTVALLQSNCPEAKVARRWELYELGLRPGDRVQTKLVAIDLKGQRGESTVVNLRIATDGFDPNRLAALKERQMLEQAMRDYRLAAEQMDTKTRDAKTIANNPAADTVQKKQALLAATAATETADRKAEEVLHQIKDMLPRTADDRDSADLALIGTAVSRAENDGIERVQATLARATEKIDAGDDKAAKAALDKIQEPLAVGVDTTRTADDAQRAMLAADEANVAARDLQQLAGVRQPAAVAQAKAIEEELHAVSEHAAGRPGQMARLAEQDLAKNRLAAEKNPTAAEPLQRSIEAAAGTMGNVANELARHADAVRQNLQEQLGNSADRLAALADQLARTNAAWQTAVEQINDRAELEERRPQADAPFVAALGQTADALQALQDAGGTNTVANVKALEQAVRKLEVGHHLDEQIATLHKLATQERWDKPKTTGEAADRDHEWNRAQQQQKQLHPQSQRAELPAEARRALEAAAHSPPAQQINTAMEQRQTANRPDLAPPLNELAGHYEKAKQQLQPVMDQARAEIAKRTPAVGDRLAGLAKAEEQLKNETAAASREDAPKLAEAQKRLDERIHDVTAAIRREANTQDLATDQGRERARDADDAAALLRQPTLDAQALLQKGDTKAAAPLQAKLAEDLKTLAEHFQNPTDATRSALREREKELGLKPTLDAEYAKAQALEKLAAMTPEQQLAELEKALPENKAMRQELSDIAKDALESAAADLQNAGQQERQIAQQPIIDQAKKLAEQAAKLARQDVPALAKQSGEAAKPELTEAGQKLNSAAQNLPQDATQPAEQIAKALQDQVAPLQQAADALAKVGPAAKPAAQQAAQLAKQAGDLAKELAQPSTPATPAEQAKQLAAEAQQLAKQDLPALAQQTGPTAKPELTNAGQKLGEAAQNIPQDFSKPPGQLAAQMQNQVAPLAQAAQDLSKAAAKLDQAAQAAQQKAATAAQAAQQAQANNAGEPAVAQAEAAAQQAQTAAQQAQASQQQAQQAAQKAGQLAQQAGQLANAMQAAAQQPGIEQAVREAGNDVARAGRHEDRLGQDAGQELQQLGQQIEQQAGEAVAQAGQQMTQNGQVQAAAQSAAAAIQAPLGKLNQALQEAAPAAGSQPATGQLAGVPEEAGKWMARALDSLDAAQNPATPGQPSQPSAEAAQAAAAQASAMAAARGQGMLPGEQPAQVPGGTPGAGGLASPAGENGNLPELMGAAGNWGKLPPKLARDLMDAQHEGVSGEYRDMVEMYFRAVAEKAREKQP